MNSFKILSFGVRTCNVVGSGREIVATSQYTAVSLRS